METEKPSDTVADANAEILSDEKANVKAVDQTPIPPVPETVDDLESKINPKESKVGIVENAPAVPASS